MQTAGLKGAKLSLLQERLWGFSQERNTYYAQCALVLSGPCNIAALRQALQEMVEQHEVLHTVFCTLPDQELPVQVIDRCYPVSCPIANLENLEPSQQTMQLNISFELLLKSAVDLSHGPLLRTILFRLSPHIHLLLFCLSALCADAATLQHFMTELSRRYDGQALQQPLAEEPLQYIDVCAWLNDLIEAEGAKLPLEFWRNIDLSQTQQMKLPLQRTDYEQNHQSGNASGFDFGAVTLALTPSLTGALKALAQRDHVSLEAILLTCWQVLLWRTTENAQPLIGVAGDGRIYEELADALGLYTRFVPMSMRLSPTQTFERLLLAVHDTLETVMQWQSYFSWFLIPDVTQGKTEARYFPIAFECQRWPEIISAGSLNIALWRRLSCIEPCALKLSALYNDDLLQLEMHYDRQHYSVEQIDSLLSMLHMLLQQSVEQPRSTINTLGLLEPLERERLLTMLRALQLSGTRSAFQQLFEDHVRRTPNHPAIQSADEQVTYQELNRHANQLARGLRRRGVGPNVVIGLYLPRSAAMIISMLAIFKAGGAYIPFDVDSPSARLAYQFQDVQPLFLLTQQTLMPHLPMDKGRILDYELLRQETAQEDGSDLLTQNTPEDLAYIIYTSGSTGVPKGVLIRQGNILNYTQACCDQLEVEPGWSFATVSTLAADLGNTAIFCALASGGCLHILDYVTITSAEVFARWVATHPIDVLKIVPSHLSALLAGEPLKESLPRRALVLGGEALPYSLVQRIQDLDGSCAIYNHYGPTETTIGVLINRLSQQGAPVDKNLQKASEVISLGRPIAGTDIYVLDQWMQMVPEGVIGELYIGGAGLANGYLHQPVQTAERFVPHPWAWTAGARLYRTGDLVCCRQGQVEFIGRRDNQVKLHGYRVELGEIEAALRRHPHIRDTVVIPLKDVQKETHIICAIVLRNTLEIDDKELRDYLHTYVPEYMIPSTFMTLKTLPLTANGKVDRQQIVHLQKNGQSVKASRLAPDKVAQKVIQPRDLVEFQLVHIWEEILQVAPISVTDNFFDLGGNSLLAVRLMSRIFKQFGKELAIPTLLQHPTVASVAVVLRQEVDGGDQSMLVALQPQGTKPPFFCVHPSGGTVFSYLHLARYLGTDYPFYGLQTTDYTRLSPDVVTIEALASQYIAALQTVQPRGPYLLGGWSMGGVVAFEMAQQLYKQGHEIALLAIFDSFLADDAIREKAREREIDLSEEGTIRTILEFLGTSIPERFYQLSLEERTKYVLEKMKKEEKFIPDDVGFEQLHRIFQTLQIHNYIARLYVAQCYPLHIDYFTCSRSLEPAHPMSEEEGELQEALYIKRWREIAAGGIEMHTVPGTHLEMIEEPNVQILAASLRKCIDRYFNPDILK